MGVLQIGNRNSVGGPKRECGLWNRKKRSLFLIVKETNCCAVLITQILLGQTFLLYPQSSYTRPWIIFAVVLFYFVKCCITVSCMCSFSFSISGNGIHLLVQIRNQAVIWYFPRLHSLHLILQQVPTLSLKYFSNWFTFLVLTSIILSPSYHHFLPRQLQCLPASFSYFHSCLCHVISKFWLLVISRTSTQIHLNSGKSKTILWNPLG